MEPYVPIEELASHLTVSVTTVRAWVRQGLIPGHTFIKVGNTYRFCISKVVDSLTADKQPEAAEPESEAPADDSLNQLELDFSNPDEDA